MACLGRIQKTALWKIPRPDSSPLEPANPAPSAALCNLRGLVPGGPEPAAHLQSQLSLPGWVSDSTSRASVYSPAEWGQASSWVPALEEGRHDDTREGSGTGAGPQLTDAPKGFPGPRACPLDLPSDLSHKCPQILSILTVEHPSYTTPPNPEPRPLLGTRPRPHAPPTSPAQRCRAAFSAGPCCGLHSPGGPAPRCHVCSRDSPAG